MIITRPLNKNEPDFFEEENLSSQVLTVKDTDGNIIEQIEPPAGGWSHDLLEAHIFKVPVWDAYLGNIWVGSSEV
ncbi:hypothetical protein OCF84_20895 (plasmid) [Shewanella xiamenensis]|uniref:Uncharacterized protein n=1 Tax=Shewanella xiamenensis TaxID=332186 RepID=A0ABT6UFM6_9GAMM|nr:hypothetical protein [Shewanella xiamenensis]MDI5833273.1 hypothetical protein [Shewanella xiamenensis]WHF57977.1 hypothetical protein OCF84_20895 [Shewanella xiamenensis]